MLQSDVSLPTPVIVALSPTERYSLFLLSKRGWGWKNFLQEANTGKGRSFSSRIYLYAKYVIPVIVLYIFIQGYIVKFFLPAG